MNGPRIWRAPRRPAPPDGQAADEAAGLLSQRGRMARRVFFIGFIGYFLFVPALRDIIAAVTPTTVFLLAAVIAFTVIVVRVAVAPARPGLQDLSWFWLTLIVALGIAIFVVGSRPQGTYLIALALAPAACGRFSATIRPATFSAISCTAAGLIVAGVNHFNEGNMAAILVIPSMAAFFAYLAGKRLESIVTLRQTRAELARMAAAEERLRIARDLHDLLGHSLSLITLKAELSRRVIDTDPERAVQELAELEAVSRQSLSDVRQAVANYRQPDLTAELGAARQLLTAAGIACQIAVPDVLGLPGEVDAVTAWTIREGITNVVRHARATSVTIAVAACRDAVTAEITDNGDGCAAAGPGTAGPALGGSGLAGLGERVRALGGDLVAEPIRPRGFRLRATIPLTGPLAAQTSTAQTRQTTQATGAPAQTTAVTVG
jgi:two-component system sensor histidine kinase DesK